MDNHGVPEALRERLGREATLGLLELVETKHMAWSDRVLSITTERFELRIDDRAHLAPIAFLRRSIGGRGGNCE